MYAVVFDPCTLDFLEKLERDTKKRIWDKIMLTKINPFYHFERLAGRTDYRLRVGDYRVIADIDRASQTIQITLIGHRKNVYERY